MICVLRIKHEYRLNQVVELLAALAEGIHLAGKEIQKRIVAIPAVEIEHSVVLVMIVLSIPGPEDVHAKGDLVLAAKDIHIVGRLETGDREPSQRAGSAPDREPAVIDR